MTANSGELWQQVRPEEFVGFELQALSALLGCWASPRITKKRCDQWSMKLPLLRAGVYAGQGKGRREYVPHDIVADEYQTIREVVNWLRAEAPLEADRYELAAWLLRNKVQHMLAGEDPRRSRRCRNPRPSRSPRSRRGIASTTCVWRPSPSSRP